MYHKEDHKENYKKNHMEDHKEDHKEDHNEDHKEDHAKASTRRSSAITNNSRANPSVSSKADTTRRFLNRYWLIYKLAMVIFNTSLVLIFCIALLLFFLMFVKAEEVYVDMAAAQQKRNFSVLVPIWGPYNGNALEHWLKYFDISLLMIGVVCLASGLLGIFAFRKGHTKEDNLTAKLHVFYIAYNLLALFIFASVIYSLTLHTSWIINRLFDALENAIKDNYRLTGEDSFTTALNALMINEDCCGVRGPEDFSDIVLYINISKKSYEYAPVDMYWPPTGSILQEVLVPPVCCQDNVFTANYDNKEDRFDAIKRCAMSTFDPNTVNIKGCGIAYHEKYFNGTFKIPGIIISAIFIFFHAGTCLVCIVRLLQHIDVSHIASKDGIAELFEETKSSTGERYESS